MLTAGHCVPTKSHCKGALWAFDFIQSSYNDSIHEFSKSNVYSCKKILKHSSSHSLFPNLGKPDFALIKLDRDVVFDDGSPRPLQKIVDKNLYDGEYSVFSIGFPIGLPMKISTGGSLKVSSNDFAKTNLILYGGSSGSAIFDVMTQEIIGVVSSGPINEVFTSEEGYLVLRHDYIGDVARELNVFLVNKKELNL